MEKKIVDIDIGDVTSDAVFSRNLFPVDAQAHANTLSRSNECSHTPTFIHQNVFRITRQLNYSPRDEKKDSKCFLEALVTLLIIRFDWIQF